MMHRSGRHEKYICPGCGAMASQSGVACVYCGTLTKAVPGRNPFFNPEHDFGFSGIQLQGKVIIIANILSIIASLLNGKSFFDSGAVIILWFLIVPLLMMITGIMKRSSTAAAVPFFLTFTSTALFSFLITVVKMNNGLRFKVYIDDSFALGAVIGSVAAGAYLAGIAIHRLIMYFRQ